MADFDYDADPQRFRRGVRVTERYATANLYDEVAHRLAAAGAGRILDAGCGEGALAGAVRSGRVLGVDRSRTLLARCRCPAACADVAALPIAAGSMDAVVAINVLYHLREPAAAVAEARRVLRPGGTFVAATTARSDSPELLGVWQPHPSSFDAEEAGAIVRTVFPDAEEEWWDAPLVVLPDAAALTDYLVARYVPEPRAVRAAAGFTFPLSITKRGVLIVAPAPR